MVLDGLYLALLVLIIAGLVILGGRSVVMASPPGLGRSVPFLDELFFLFCYPVGSGRALLAGTLPLRYCFDRFACRTLLGGCLLLVVLVT